MRKNATGQRVSALLLDVSGSPVGTGVTTVYVDSTGLGLSAGAGTVAYDAQGSWDYSPSQAETNATHVKFVFTNGSAVSVGVNVYPDEAADAASANGTVLATMSGNLATMSADLTTISAGVANVISAQGVMSGNLTTMSADLTTISANAAANYSAVGALNDFDPASTTVMASVVAWGGYTLETSTLASAGATTIELNAGAGATGNFYKGNLIVICTGAGSGQGRVCTAYDGTTKVATVDPAWAVTPTAAETYVILPFGFSIIDANNPVVANIKQINSTSVTGVGTLGDPWGPS